MTFMSEIGLYLNRAGVSLDARRIVEINISNESDINNAINSIEALDPSDMLVTIISDLEFYPSLVRGVSSKFNSGKIFDIFALLKIQSPEITCVSKIKMVDFDGSFSDFTDYRIKKPGDFPDVFKFKMYENIANSSLQMLQEKYLEEERDGMGSLVRWLADYGFYAEASSLAETLIHDVDSKHVQDLDLQVKGGESASVIYGVKAAVCWSLQKLALSASSFMEANRLTQIAMKDSLAYNKLQSCFPLIEVAKRAHVYLSSEGLDVLRDAILTFFRENISYPAFEEYFTHILGSFRSFRKEDRLEILNKMDACTSVGILHVLYGANILNDRREIVTSSNLKDFIANSENFKGIGRAVWYMFRVVIDSQDQIRSSKAFEEFSPFIDIVVQRDFSYSIHGNISVFSEPLAEKFPERFVDWTIETGKKFLPIIAEKAKNAVVFYKPDKVLNLCVDLFPNRALEFYSILFAAWRAGAHMGNPLDLFKLAESPRVQQKDLIEIKKMYSEMRSTNPNLDSWT